MFKNRKKNTYVDIYPIYDKSILESNNISEIRSLPFRLTLEINIDGEKLYSSPELKSKYIEIMNNEEKTKPIISTLEKLVDNNLITPCWMNKNLFQLIKFKLFSNYAISGILGFYIKKYHRIFLLMDNNVDMSLKKIWNLGKASDYWLSSLTLHEGIHMFSMTVKKRFLQFFQPELDSWYTFYFQNVFQLKVVPEIMKGIRELYTFFYTQFENNNNVEPNKYFNVVSKLLDINFRKLSQFDSNTFEQRTRDYLTFSVIALNDVNKLDSLVKTRKYDHIFKPFYMAYKKSFNMSNVNSFCFQELWYPSEVIAIMSESKYLKSKIYSAFKKIK